MQNKSLNSFVKESFELLNSKKFNEVISNITSFLKDNSANIDHERISFINIVEKELYEKYYGPIDCEISPISHLYLILAIAYSHVFEFDEAQKNLKIAKKINPISPEIQLALCNCYKRYDNFDKIKEILDNIFKFNYKSQHFYETYLILSIYQYKKGDFLLCHHLTNFVKREDNRDITEDIHYINDKNIPITFDNEMIGILKDNDYELYKKAINYNAYIRSFFYGVDLERITENIRILIANNQYEDAIKKLERFFNDNSLDESKNYFMFHNHIEMEFYYESSDFDENHILFSKEKNYPYLYYLYGFCHESLNNYKEAIVFYKKALEFNPYSFNVNMRIINIYLEHNFTVDYKLLVFLESISYDIKDLLNVYRAFEMNLELENKEDESDIILAFTADVTFGSFDRINQKAFDIFKNYNFNVSFNEKIISIIDNAKNQLDSDSDDYKYYENLEDNICEFNLKMAELKGNDVEIKSEYKLINEYGEEELLGSYVLIKDFENRNIVTYCYRQVTGSLFFVFLTTAEIDDEIKINPRGDIFNDIIYPKEVFNDNEAIVLDELTQFYDYLDIENDYSRFIKFNISGDAEKDKTFLIKELLNIKDDTFGLKRDSIGEELRKLININEIMSKDISCNEIIEKVNTCKDYTKSLELINGFLEKYPPLYFNSPMKSYYYFNENECELYRKYNDNHDLIELIPQNQNYCEIFNLKAECLIKLDSYEDAKQCILNSLSLNPMNVKAHIILADLNIKEKNIDLAISLLKKSLLYNTDIALHCKIYNRLSELTNDEKLSKDLKSLIELMNKYDENIILEIKDNIINNNILLGFNKELIENDEFYLGNTVSKILQEINPIMENYPLYAAKKLEKYLRDISNSNEYGFEVPFKKIDAPLLYSSQETSTDLFYNFRNEIEQKIFNTLYTSQNKRIIAPEDDYAQLLSNYGYCLISFERGKSRAILKEALKLNPVNSQILLNMARLNKYDYNMEEYKKYLDKVFEVCYEKDTLIKAYEELKEYLGV